MNETFWMQIDTIKFDLCHTVVKKWKRNTPTDTFMWQKNKKIWFPFLFFPIQMVFLVHPKYVSIVKPRSMWVSWFASQPICLGADLGFITLRSSIYSMYNFILTHDKWRKKKFHIILQKRRRRYLFIIHKQKAICQSITHHFTYNWPQQFFIFGEQNNERK